MSSIMCEERGASGRVPKNVLYRQRYDDLRLGWLELNHGRTTTLVQSGVDQELRTDQTPIS